MGRLTELFIGKTIRANEAKTTIERTRYCDERRGVLDSIVELYGQLGGGSAVMAADRYYIGLGYKGNMTGGLHHDWNES